MSVKIDVVYCDGEVVEFHNQNPAAKNLLTLVRNLQTALEFRFCTPDGESVDVVDPEDFRSAQLILSSRDRLLAATEENITLERDEDGFLILKAAAFNIDNEAVRELLADSYLDLEPRRRGTVLCELSAALYTTSDDRQMQLFFTMEAIVKNPILPGNN